MGFVSNIMKSMRLNQNDDYNLEEDYDFQDEGEDEYEDEPREKPGLFRRNNDAPAEEDRPRPTLFKKQPQRDYQEQRGMELTMIKPTSMDDSRDICDYLLDGKAVVLNMEGLHMEIAQRIIDFTSGAAYSMNGNLQKISNYIFIATPEDVALSGDFQNILQGNADVNNVSTLNLRV